MPKKVWKLKVSPHCSASVSHYFTLFLRRAIMLLIWVLCHRSLSCSTLWHHCPGVCARLHGAGLETAELHRRCWHHRLLCGLPWGHRWRAWEVAWGQHQGCQWEGLQGELILISTQIWLCSVNIKDLQASLSKAFSSCLFVFRCLTWRRIRSTSSRWGQPTWQVSASHHCPVTPSCVRSGPSLCQVG